MKRTPRPPVYIPNPRMVRLAPDHYQPRKAEREEETDMPSMSDDELRRTFFRPFRFVREGSE